MKKSDKINLITVGNLLKELKRYEKESLEYTVTVDIPDGSTLNIMGTGLDKDGDLSIEVDEDPDEGYFDVRTLIDELEGYAKSTRVYLEGCGLYLTFKVNAGGRIVSGDDDEEEIVGFDAYAFGEYKYEPSGWLTESEKRELAEKARKEKREARTEFIVLAILTVVIFIGLCYNVYALVVHSARHAMWENIGGVIVCVFLLVICGATLYYSKDK